MGIEVDPKKTDAVKSWPRPLYPSDIRSFLGLASYYRWFVEGFSSIASPLTTLTQNKNDLNLRQRRWLELLMDYDMTVLYHPGAFEYE
ncbi:hypothetical protein MTR67_012268 [Solanum verrucosum]|uniref:Reverse transcriptase n=1 Tax=Solanum verrucosum TaxID=315347 RepID=A0AAF0Q9E6_SOLVR|nr:hypothetical protein MTR67_012268 [Solanum verrucosum]